jgi:hypothetical protein
MRVGPSYRQDQARARGAGHIGPSVSLTSSRLLQRCVPPLVSGVCQAGWRRRSPEPPLRHLQRISRHQRVECNEP